MARIAWGKDFGKTPEQSIEEFNKEIVEPVVNHPVTKVSGVLVTELTPAGDAMRIGLGVDPYTGEKLTWKEREKEAAQTIAFNYGGKILKTSKAIKKVINPKIFELQDKVGGKVDDLRAIDDGIEKSFNE